MSYTSRKSVSVRRDTASGFTLIELAIVMVIAGFFMVGLIKAYELYLVEQRQRQQDARMDEMRRSLAEWVQDKQCVDETGTERPESWCADPANAEFAHLGNEGAGPNGQDAVRYPCPADPRAAPGDPDYATEQTTTAGGAVNGCDSSGGVQKITDGGTVVGYRGAFPARTVGLAPSTLVDPYGNKYSYVVSANVVAQGDLLNSNPQGNIEISDGAGTFDSRFALFSHGENGGDAFTRHGEPTASSATGAEAENTNGDNEFAMRQGHYMARGTGQYYDDSFAASLVDEDDDGWWYATDDSGQHITHRNPENVIMGTNSNSNVGIGTNNPQQKLEIDDTVRVGNVHSNKGTDQSDAQANAFVDGDGFLAAPWLYAQGITASNERHNAGTGIALGKSALPDGTTTSHDTLSLYTNGLTRLLIDDAGNVEAKNNISAQGRVSASQVHTDDHGSERLCRANANGRIMCTHAINVSCPSGQVLTGIQNGSAQCTSVYTVSTGSGGGTTSGGGRGGAGFGGASHGVEGANEAGGTGHGPGAGAADGGDGGGW